MQNFVWFEIGAFESFGRKFYRKNNISVLNKNCQKDEIEENLTFLMKNQSFSVKIQPLLTDK